MKKHKSVWAPAPKPAPKPTPTPKPRRTEAETLEFYAQDYEYLAELTGDRDGVYRARAAYYRRELERLASA